MLLAVRVHAFGAPDTYVLEPFDPGRRRPITSAARARDRSQLRRCARGERSYQLKPPLPFVPGTEVAGVLSITRSCKRAALRPGEIVLVLGASGAVGQAAVQLAKALGGNSESVSRNWHCSRDAPS